MAKLKATTRFFAGLDVETKNVNGYVEAGETFEIDKRRGDHFFGLGIVKKVGDANAKPKRAKKDAPTFAKKKTEEVK